MKPELDIIIVNWNTEDHLRRCLESLKQPLYEGRVKVTVVDNASADGSVQMVQAEFPWVELIASETNLGFGRANNLALKQADGEFALLLNSDIVAYEGAIEAMLAQMRANPRCGALGGRLILPSGRTQSSVGEMLNLWWLFCEQSLLAKVFPRTKLFGGYNYTWWDYESNRQVKQVVGACLMMRRMADGQFPLFDDRYFMYAEDTELCDRIAKAGLELHYTPKARFRHELGASSEQAEVRTSMIAHYNISRLLFFQDHGGVGVRLLCQWILVGGALLRMLIAFPRAILRPRTYPTNAAMWWGVLTRTVRGR